MVVAHTPETTNPVSTICEIVKVPCISALAPWLIGHQDDPTTPQAGPTSTTFTIIFLASKA